MTRNWKALLGLVGMAILLYYATVSRRGWREQAALSPAPEFSLPDLTGRKVSLSSFKGQVVLLDFWATWCDPCLEELPELKSLHEKYKEKGFELVGVSLDVLGQKVVSPFVRENRIPYPILLSGGWPPEGYVLPGLPTAFLIDRQGLVVRRYMGPKRSSDLARDIEALLTR